MRVLENQVVSSYSMGKKNKHKLRKTKENENSDSSEEVSGKGCMHVNKAVNFSTMKKGLAKQEFGECAGCAKDAAKKGEPKSLMDHLEGATSGDFIEEAEVTIWVCLQCGNQGCGRTSPEKHALKHYETPRSSQHNVVINTSSWAAWCYECDDELSPEKYKKIAECMDFLKKLACVPSMDAAQSKNSNGSTASAADSGQNKSWSLSGKGAASGCQKVKGLSNLGNTCFFNAVMQNLVQTYSLENLLGERKKGVPLKLQGDVFLEPESSSSSDEGENEKNQKNSFLKDLPSIEVSIADPGPLTQALVVFLHNINTTSSGGCINPSQLFGQVCKKAPRFKGMQQQDSHELLRYLMDNMKTEEIKRGQSGILKYFKLSENTNPKKVDEDVRLRVKAYGHQIKHTFVECLFGGQLISTVVCEECKYISQVLEPFLDLSLPVTEEKPQRPNQLHGTRKKDGTAEVEEGPASKDHETTSAKDEKVSKHQSKKAKKRQKREARRQGKKSSPVDGVKNEEGEDKDDEADEKDEGEDGEKNGDQEEKEDASDADVEDNLESDTSRCYSKNLSDSIAGSMDETLVEQPDQPTISQEMDISAYRLDSTLNTSSEIDNQSESCDYVITSQTSGLDSSNVNEPIGEAVTNAHADDLNVSYTIANGCLTENTAQRKPIKEHSIENVDASFTAQHQLIKENSNDNVEASFTFTCNSNVNENICNGDLHVDPDKEKLVITDSNSKTQHRRCVSDSNTINPGKDKLVNDIGNRTLGNSEDKLEAYVTDMTSSLSTLSIGNSSSLASNLSQMTLKDEHEDELEKDNKKLSENNSETLNNDTISKTGEHILPNGDIHASNIHSKHVGTARYNKLKELKLEGQRKSVNPLVERYHPSSGECSLESCLNQFTSAELLTGNNKFGCKNCTKIKYKNNPHKEKKEAVYSNANKQYLIFQPPAVLTLHLKRFEQVGFSSRKVNRHVDFPFVLDIAPYCSSLTQGIKPGQKKILYALYGVVEHSGRLTSGHYTAYVKVRPHMGTLNNFLNKHNVTLKEYLSTYAQRVSNGDNLEVDASDDVNLEGLVLPGRWYHISDSRVNEVTVASVERAQAYLLFYERIY